MRVTNEEIHMYNSNSTHNLNNNNSSLSDNTNKNINNDTHTQQIDKPSDHDYIGMAINHNKNKTIQKRGCNPGGFRITTQGGDFQEFCDKMFQYNIDVLCVSEINFDTTNYKVRDIIQNCAKRQFHNKARVNFSSSNIPTKIFYKPGVTMVLTTGN